MAVANYVALGGSIYSEIDATGRLDYMTAALGSVTGTVTSVGAVQNTYRYKPYGAVLAQSGTGTAPKFQWVGTAGYRATGQVQAEVYVRARHYGQLSGRWTSVDRLWPDQAPYAYSEGSPTMGVDSSGNGPQKGASPRACMYKCPAPAVCSELISYVNGRKKCKESFEKVAGIDIGSALKSVNVAVSNLPCDPNYPNANSSFFRKALPKGQPCAPDYICYTKHACSLPVKEQACLLLIEVVNWFSCKNLNQFNENASLKVDMDCGLYKICHPLTVRPPGK